MRYLNAQLRPRRSFYNYNRAPGDIGTTYVMTTPRVDPQPLTSHQAVQPRRDLTLVEERLQDIANFMRICYGEDSQAVIRAAAAEVGVGRNERAEAHNILNRVRGFWAKS
jgi:hypothetical protein